MPNLGCAQATCQTGPSWLDSGPWITKRTKEQKGDLGVRKHPTRVKRRDLWGTPLWILLETKIHIPYIEHGQRKKKPSDSDNEAERHRQR